MFLRSDWEVPDLISGIVIYIKSPPPIVGEGLLSLLP